MAGEGWPLTTTRLRLEPLRTDHAAAMVSGLSDPALYRFIPDDPPVSLAALSARYARQAVGHSPAGDEIWLNWIAYRHDLADPIGYFQATLRPPGDGFVAYLVFGPHQGQGLARDGLYAVTTAIFTQTNTPAVIAEIDTRNTASIRLVRSLGFAEFAKVPGADRFKGMVSDEVHYRLMRP